MHTLEIQFGFLLPIRLQSYVVIYNPISVVLCMHLLQIIQRKYLQKRINYGFGVTHSWAIIPTEDTLFVCLL